jgi:hypothetical protein
MTSQRHICLVTVKTVLSSAIEPGELDVLSERIQLVRDWAISRTKKRQDEAKAAVTDIFDQIKDNVGFTTVEELIAALSGTAPVVSERHYNRHYNRQ